MRHVARWCSNVAAPAIASAAAANSREIVFVCGMGLFAYGLAQVSMPAAFIIPGAILVWLAIPPQVPKRK